MSDQEEMENDPMELYRRVFDLFDHDGSGMIDVKELGQTLRLLGKNPSDADVHEIVTMSDWDGDHRLNFDEFCVLVHRDDVADVADRNNQEDIVKAFQKFDPADTGFVKVSHLKKVLSEAGEKLTDDEIEAFVRHADPNGDGHVDYAKVAEMMCHTEDS